MFDDNEDNSMWTNLKTIASFDAIDPDAEIYNPHTTLFHLSNGLINIPKASTPVSLLVESLVQQLCMMIEKDPEKSSILYTKICNQLCDMNLIDETYKMGEFETMRSQYQRALYQLVSVAQGHDLPATLQNVWPLTQPIGLDWSRYHRDFEELNFIAGGGYGKVFRAKNKLDARDYAIKKITIKAKTINQVLIHLSEVKTLASLDHINIVSYKAAWLEPLIANSNDEEKSIKGMNNDDSESQSLTEDYCTQPANSTSRVDSSSTDFIEFLSNDENLTSNEIDECSSLKICNFKKSGITFKENKPHLKLKWATLYIQMTLCQQTLREWLDERNTFPGNFEEFYGKCLCEKKLLIHKNTICRIEQTTTISIENMIEDDDILDTQLSHCNIVTDIFCQLLNGLKYIHGRNITHHDIKPSNIFVGVMDGKMVIQLGDFGQACPLQNSHSGYGFGTPLYAAPEQLKGDCNKKSDIYSLGIVLLELLVPFSTDMERAETIKKLKTGEIPKNINSCFANLLKRLIKHHTKRPDINQLIEIMNHMNVNKDNEIIALQRRISEKDEEIEVLKLQIPDEQMQSKMLNELKSKDNEIIDLKTKIEQMKINDDMKEDEIIRLKKELHDCRYGKM